VAHPVGIYPHFLSLMGERVSEPASRPVLRLTVLRLVYPAMCLGGSLARCQMLWFTRRE
jgi:hypothetical protein